MGENKIFYNNFLNKYIYNKFGPLFIENQSVEDLMSIQKFILFTLKNYFKKDITTDKKASYSLQ